MAERVKRGLELVVLVLSAVMGATSLGLLVWKGGALVNDHEQLKARVATIENNGSRMTSEHIKLDDLRDRVESDRLTKLEAIVDLIPDLSSKMGIISYKIDELKSSVEDHKRQTEKRIQ